MALSGVMFVSQHPDDRAGARLWTAGVWPPVAGCQRGIDRRGGSALSRGVSDGTRAAAKGTGIFQWLLTLGIVTAALVGVYFSFRVDQVAKLGDAANYSRSKTRRGAAFSGCRCLREFCSSSAALWSRNRPAGCCGGKKAGAYAALLRSRSTGRPILSSGKCRKSPPPKTGKSASAKANDSLLRRKYVIPFVLACIILACNQATGINSIIAYNTNILLQSGLSDVAAHWGYVVFTIINFAVTFGGVMLVDRKGRKFLLGIGTLASSCR
jgi:SP family myo-inositol transporter-like MFS transporter 13